MRMASIGAPKGLFAGVMAPIMRYERHLAAAGMVAGFGIDNLTFGRIDRPGAHLIFGSYLFVAAATIAAAHRLQTRADEREKKRLAFAAAAPIPDPNAQPAAEAVSADRPLTAARASRVATEHLENGSVHTSTGPRWRKWLPAATQFALGGLWSGFLVFYWRKI